MGVGGLNHLLGSPEPDAILPREAATHGEVLRS